MRGPLRNGLWFTLFAFLAAPVALGSPTLAEQVPVALAPVLVGSAYLLVYWFGRQKH